MKNQRIYLVGFMGSGKSFIGKKLAETLGFDFLDMDGYIESVEKQTIAAIFEHKGEPYFRNLESEMLQQTVQFQNTIIATGGGMPCFFDNMDFMNANGCTIFLNSSIDVLFHRLKSETDKRPLLKGLSDEALRVFISQKLENRLKYYEKASLIINIPNFEVDIIKIIKSKIE